MTKKEIEEAYESGKVVSMYDKYHAGEISRNEWVLFLIDLLENYIKEQIRLKHRTMSADYEDLLQEGYCAIVAMADAYDPHRGKATSFFVDYINQYTRAALNNEGMTSHYVAAASKMDKAAKMYGYEGCTDQRLTPDTLAILADLPLATVLETLKCKSRQFISIEACEGDNWVAGEDDSVSYRNPEETFFENETKKVVQEQLAKLSPLEKYLLDNTVLSDNPKSYRKLTEILRKKENFARFESELPKTLTKVNQVFLEQKTNSALRKLKYSAPLQKLFYMPKEDNFDIIEQATDEDIAEAFENNLIDLAM
jgi:DNA-directed RNA polymerase specialized sigma subunit